MIDIVYGRSEISRTEKVVQMINQLKTGHEHIFVIVPDRQSAAMEARIAEGSTFGQADVLDFKRLADYVLRKNGGICREYISTASKQVMMNSVLSQKAAELKEYGKIAETDLRMTDLFVRARSELYHELISVEDIQSASEKVDGKLGNKLCDLSTVFRTYDEKIQEKWRDPDGVLSVVREKLLEKNCFAHGIFFLDGFKSLNRQQTQIMEIILKEADYACLSLAFDPLRDKGKPLYGEIEGMDRWLCRFCQENHLETHGIFVEQQSGCSKEISFLTENYWPGTGLNRCYKEKPENIRIAEAGDRYGEAEFVAWDIQKRIREGIRWNEFAIIIRDAEQYRGILDAVLEKYHIPYFYLGKTDLNSLSVIRFILSALEMAEHGMNGDSFLSYIKADYCGIDPDDLFVFENYIHKWNITGRKLQSEFVENPRGMQPFTEEDTALLLRINAVRSSVVGPLSGFFGRMKGSGTVRERCTVLYGFLKEMNVPEKTAEESVQYHLLGDYTKELILSQIWKKICDAMNTLVVSVGDEKCSFTKFRTYLQAVFAQTNIGSIPLELDEVVICEAALNNVQGKNHVYVLGAHEGGFPASVGEEGIFTEQEKEALSGVGIDISSRLMLRLSRELYYFYQAVTSGRMTLTVTYTGVGSEGEKHEPSSGIRQLCRLFPELRIMSAAKKEESDPVWDEESAFEYCVSHNDSLSVYLKSRFETDPVYAERLKQSAIPMTAKDCRISSGTAEKLFGPTIAMSSSLLEKYVKCHFSYFCDHELKLNDGKQQKFSPVDVGNFIHKLLEETVRFVAENPEAGEEKIDEKIRQTAVDYLKQIIHSEIPERVRHTTDFLCDSTKNFVKQIQEDFRSGGFYPVDYELGIGKNGIAPLEISDDDAKVKIFGKIDRVDAYRDDGGNVHILISDYKTGTKKFKLDNIPLGLDLQMLLYLFSIKENGKERYGGPVIPSGISYVGVKPQSVDSLGEKEEAEEFTQSGMLFSDAVPIAGESSVTAIKPVIDDSEAGTIEKEVSEAVLAVAKNLKGGNAVAGPLPGLDRSPCEYCSFGPLCRNAGGRRTEGEENP